jgi:SOS-response transcriptional repressor LexA
MKPSLTGPQRALLLFCLHHFREHGSMPTRREMMDHFKWSSPNAATVHLHALERKKYITRGKGSFMVVGLLDQLRPVVDMFELRLLSGLHQQEATV